MFAWSSENEGTSCKIAHDRFSYHNMFIYKFLAFGGESLNLYIEKSALKVQNTPRTQTNDNV